MTTRRPWRLGAAALMACLGLALCAVPVLADGDPASDYLGPQDVFLPLPPATPAKSATAPLERLVEASLRGRHGYKVAIIASKWDLGAIYSLAGKPQPYADFLYQEIELPLKVAHATLVVVMQQGFGIAGPEDTPAARAAAGDVRIPAAASSAQLAQAAADGVAAIAAANGHPFPHAVAGSTASSGGQSGRWILLGGLALVLVAGMVLAMRLRVRRARQ